MTEDNSPKPTKKTSAVPLRKETVRVTLKANPSDRAHADATGAPPEPAPTIALKSPSSSVPAVPPPTALPPQAPKIPQSPPTVKLQSSGQAPNPVAAPTVAASTFAGAENLVPPPKPSTLKIATPDFTEPLNSDAEVPDPAPTVGLATPGTPPPVGASSQPLPKATVQITQAMSVPDVAAGVAQFTTAKADDLEDAAADRAESTNTAFSIVALVAAVILLGLQLGTANVWVNDDTIDNPGWGRLFD